MQPVALTILSPVAQLVGTSSSDW